MYCAKIERSRKFLLYLAILVLAVSGCAKTFDKADIVKIVDFELSPDEEKIAFAAVTPVGNTDIWVVDIGGTNLKKLTFKDNSPTNHLARFFKKQKWRNFYEVNMCTPRWTKDGDVSFCQKLTKHNIWGVRISNLRYLTVKPDGTQKRPTIEKPQGPVNRYRRSERSEKHNKEILRKEGALWFLDDGESAPERLIQ